MSMRRITSIPNPEPAATPGRCGAARMPQLLLATALLALATLPAAAQNSFGTAPGQQAPQQQSPQQPPRWQQPQQQQPQQQQQQPPSGDGQRPAQQAPRGLSPEQMTQAERQDFGVRAPAGLHSGAMHGPTPNTLPGGQVITTPGLVALLRNGAGGQGAQGEWQQTQPGQSQGQGQSQALRQTQALVFDVLGGPERLPGALNAVPAHQAGSFDDNVQREFGQFLQSVTQGRQDTPLVFYCQSTHCWMSYNAALRATRMGYRNVLWYRGGVEAWKAAGLPLQQSQQQSQQQQQQPQPQLQQQPQR